MCYNLSFFWFLDFILERWFIEGSGRGGYSKREWKRVNDCDDWCLLIIKYYRVKIVVYELYYIMILE